VGIDIAPTVAAPIHEPASSGHASGDGIDREPTNIADSRSSTA
jgi:hypothetical protein